MTNPIPSTIDPNDSRLQPADDWVPKQTDKAKRQVRILVGLSLLASVWYLYWLLQPSRIGNPYLYGLLIAAEAFNIAQAFGFWWTVAGKGKFKKRARVRGTMDPNTEVDVFIPTYSEPVDIVEATIARAIEMTGARVNVWILDDGDRPAMEDLAASYGVGYITREVHNGAKAGNINHALGVTKAPYVLILDCDHVPLSHFLEATLPDFKDDKVAFVQTPQYYANHNEGPIPAASWSQQAIFFGAIGQGKDVHDAMFCCGTNVVFRRAALDDIGGFPTDSITEDFELSLHMFERGWKATYVDETLALGLAPEDMASYVSQQHRWARGCLSALPRILKSSLPLRLRAQFLLSSLYFLSGFTVLIYMTLPIMANLFGLQAFSAGSADQFLVHFVPYYGLCLYTLARAGQGTFAFSAFALSQASFWIQIHAAYRQLLRRPSKFVVTPKKGEDTRQIRAVFPAVVMLGLLLGSSLYGLTGGFTPGTLNNVGFATLHIAVITAGIWPAFVKGQGKKKPERVIDLTESNRPQLSLVRSAEVAG